VTSVPPSIQHPGSLPSRPELPEGAHVPEPPPQGDLPRVGVPIWAPFLVVLIAFAGALVAQTLLAAVIAATGGDLDGLDSDAALVGTTVVLDALLIAAAVWVVRWLARGRPTPATFGLRAPSWLPALGWSATAYVFYWMAAALVLLALGEPAEQDIVTDLKAEDSLAVLVAFGVMTCLVAPLAEEFFFRGFLFRVLQEKSNVVIAVIATGVAFGLVHLPSGDIIGVIVLGVFGMALCVLLIRTSSLIPCIMLHAFHNSLMFGFTKELPWWGFLLLIVASVMTTLAISLLAMRVARRASPAPV
jgi:membrane protease YdiL (CAAX protease family)